MNQRVRNPGRPGCPGGVPPLPGRRFDGLGVCTPPLGGVSRLSRLFSPLRVTCACACAWEREHGDQAGQPGHPIGTVGRNPETAEKASRLHPGRPRTAGTVRGVVA